MFVIVIGAFNLRKRTQVDDAARQVMSEIAKVRNAAQQGEGPTTKDGEEKLKNGGPNELFGQAIEFVINCGSNESCMKIYKLMQTPDNKIVPFESETKTLPQKLRWFIPAGSDIPPDCGAFVSCYGKPGLALNTMKSNTGPLYFCSRFANCSLMIVIKNNTGETFVKTRATFVPDSMAPSDNVKDYTSDFQGNLRIAFAQIGNTSGTYPEQIANAPYQYYAKFDLSVPNNQSLEVVK
jgi:hypothetical protein